MTASSGTDTSDFPAEGVEITIRLVVGNLERSRLYYRDVLGTTETEVIGDAAVVLDFQGITLLLVTGAGPTPDRPEVTFRPPADIEHVSLQLTIRVPDCRRAYQVLVARGAKFLTPPVEYESDVRCFFRDPDGHLLEISQSK